MADGNLVFNTKLDSSGFEQGAKKLSSKVIGLKNKIHDTETEIKSLTQELEKMAKMPIKSDAAKNLEKEIDKAKGKLSSLYAEADNIGNTRQQELTDLGLGTENLDDILSRDSAWQKVQTQIGTAEEKLKSYENELRQVLAAEEGISGKDTAEYQQKQERLESLSGELEVYNAKLRETEQAESGAASQTKNVSNVTEEYQKTLKAAKSGLESFSKNVKSVYSKMTGVITRAFKRVFVSGIVLAGMRSILSNIKDGLGDIARINPAVNANLSQLTSSFEYMKNSIAAAFTPLISVVTPILTKFMDVVTRVIDKVAQMIAVLSGSKTYTKAVKQQVDYAASLDSSTKSTKANTKAIEENQKSLAGFDELNVLQDNSSSDNSDTEVAAAPIFETAEVALDGLKSKVKGLFSKLYENSGFSTFVSKVQGGMDKVDWSSIHNNISNIVSKSKPLVKSALSQAQRVGVSAMGALGSAVGMVITVSGKGVQTLTGGISRFLNKYGPKVEYFINTIGNNLSKGFNNVSKICDNLGTIIGNSIDRVRPIMEESIADFLGGFTEFYGSIGEIISGAFAVGTESLNEWLENDGAVIGEFFDNLQLVAADVMSTLGMIFGGIGSTLSEWWNKDGERVFKGVCDAFNNVKTTLMNVFNKWIKPIWDAVVAIVQDAWQNCLQPIFAKLLEFFGKVGECISTVWNNFLSPVVNWIVTILGPVIKEVFGAVKTVLHNVFSTIKNVFSDIFDALGGLIDFITGVFSGDWEKAWNGIVNFFRGIVNIIIDLVNGLWSGIYTAIAAIGNAIGGIVSSIGDLLGKDWGWNIPTDPPLIPRLATGTVVPASFGEFLAVLGDNKREPEVVSPLSTMKQALTEALSEYGSVGNKDIHLTLMLDRRAVFDEMVSLNGDYIKSHGYSAFAKG